MPRQTHAGSHALVHTCRPVNAHKHWENCQFIWKTLYKLSYRSALWTKPRSQTHRFICQYNSGLAQLTSVMSFCTPWLRVGRKCWHGHLSHEFQPKRRESADTADCVSRKSQQRSEIKCRQLLLCTPELRCCFNISYLLQCLAHLVIVWPYQSTGSRNGRNGQDGSWALTFFFVGI